ncbi:MAG: dimethylarginine dimethylaminohydrolase family protein [Gammaproteobacteria bacterium]
MSTNSVWVDSETGRLRRVVIGSPHTFVLPEPINQKQREWLTDESLRPTRERLIPEFQSFQSALEDHGVEVIVPEPVDGVPDQLTPRDIGVVISDVFVRMRMATSCRANEWRGIERIIQALPESSYLVVPDTAVLEGGDVVVDQNFIFVGTGERSNEEGVAFLHERFGDRYEVIQVPLRGESHGEDILHLDCAFVPLGKGKALIYPDGMAQIPDAIRDTYDWIEVTKAEQQILSTNVLSLDSQTVISRSAATRINETLREHGLDVIEIVFADTPKSGGSFRCASLPLNRDAP